MKVIEGESREGDVVTVDAGRDGLAFAKREAVAAGQGESVG
jgi:hypothetical protein